MSDIRNGEFTRSNGFSQVADPCRPVFEEVAVQSGEIDGRKTYKMVERVKILMPGNGLSIPVVNVTDEHRERWPREYAAFKQGLEPDLNGTPLEEWAILNKAQVLELKAMNIRTIEDVAGLPDTAVQRIGRGGYALRERAQAFMDEAKEQAILTRVTKENEDMREDIAAMRAQLAEMGALTERLAAQNVAHGDAQNPAATITPASLDRAEAAKPIYAPQENSSSFDNMATKRRPGRPRKDAAA